MYDLTNPRESVNDAADESVQPFPWPQPGRLWSLYDLVKKLPIHLLLDAGQRVEACRTVFGFLESGDTNPLTTEEKQDRIAALTRLRTFAAGMEMEASTAVLDRAVNDLPNTMQAFNFVISVVEDELRKRQAFFIPPDRAVYFEKDDLLKEATRDAFPGAASEMREAGNAFAASLPTGCVFHCSRAVEIGTRALAESLGCTFAVPLDQVDLGPMLDQCEKKIVDMKQQPRTPTKSDDLKFYSQAAFDFRLFKDACRVHVAHARASYTEQQALSILTRTVEFFDALAERLKEPTKVV